MTSSCISTRAARGTYIKNDNTVPTRMQNSTDTSTAESAVAATMIASNLVARQ
jgi:hypothetical protein